MSDDRVSRSRPSGDRHAPDPNDPDANGEHPKGTLAVVAIYGLLFVLGWLALYFFVFLPRGTITP